MAQQNPNSIDTPPSSSSSSSETRAGGKNGKYPNPRETKIPDAATLRDQWRYATRQYSRWYSQAWGAAILAGAAFFALGWIIKGGNPLPSLQKKADDPPPPSSSPDSTSRPV